MCEWGNTTKVHVKVSREVSCTEEARWDYMEIDSCIAPIVEALQEAGWDMHCSCCGHGKEPGQIDLVDGRVIVIFSPEQFKADSWTQIKTLTKERDELQGIINNLIRVTTILFEISIKFLEVERKFLSAFLKGSE